MAALKFLVVMDDIRTLNYKKDTTLAMLWALQERGHSAYYCQIQDLWLANISCISTVSLLPHNMTRRISMTWAKK